MSASPYWGNNKNYHILFFIRIKRGKIFKTFRIVLPCTTPPTLIRYLLLWVLLLWLLPILREEKGIVLAEKAAKSGKGVSREAVRPPVRKDPWASVKSEWRAWQFLSVRASDDSLSCHGSWAQTMSLSLQLQALLFVMLSTSSGSLSLCGNKGSHQYRSCLTSCLQAVFLKNQILL